MKTHLNWMRIMYIVGVIALAIGALDPLEGSVVIVAGIILTTLSTYLVHDRHRKVFLTAAMMIIVGVFFLFYLSSLGGFGGNSSLSWWWGTLILPYPLGWLIAIITLINRAIKKRKWISDRRI
ncbi:MAG TPA: hypothetical protein PKE03_10030 [Bacteroidales bacterium]|nr:hypothetical protein [Bacteroidales bacterium]